MHLANYHPIAYIAYEVWLVHHGCTEKIPSFLILFFWLPQVGVCALWLDQSQVFGHWRALLGSSLPGRPTAGTAFVQARPWSLISTYWQSVCFMLYIRVKETTWVVCNPSHHELPSWLALQFRHPFQTHKSKTALSPFTGERERAKCSDTSTTPAKNGLYGQSKLKTKKHESNFRRIRRSKNMTTFDLGTQS